MKQQFIGYNTRTEFRSMDESGNIPDTRGNVCISIENLGTTDIVLNGVKTIRPGEEWVNSQLNAACQDQTSYNLQFASATTRALVALVFAQPFDATTGQAIDIKACPGY
ncbi:MAG: hypothetical protein EOP50_00895 [Sphingobacteriales bacterium]|nr:MAG: hypothetical protein EOP50_00895 [Sphingobacteriales bacterium]